ncbi:Transposase IS200 like protein [Roseimaritima multifibrata]|uniref:Transposase IS200 like protein n=1 Tax=Roseimaritima multifibrata TaxID=1930274 RepID=A0A517MC53_9BACT|nr:transposase [Roseimaritima multifibrata]QDS92445.1 Transposase IS200 like protein [Roseimaritima multifibrata]
MPRPLRSDVAGQIYHALNRGNKRQTVFHKAEDYEAFERVIAEGLANHPVDMLSYCWMPNHWHMVLVPQEDGAMGRFLHWVTMTHSARHHAHFQTTGTGHVYQGRFKSFPIQDDEHFFVVCRYVERNAYAAGLCETAEAWRWGSLWNWATGRSPISLAKWPVPRLPNWIQRVNQAIGEKERKQLLRCIERGQPFGESGWVESTARSLNLESTLRNRGRPKKIIQIKK